MSDDLIGSGGTDLKNLHGAGAGSRGGNTRKIQLFDKDDAPAGSLIVDVVSVEKEGMAGTARAPAAGAPVGTGAGLGAGAGAAASGVGGAGGGGGARGVPVSSQASAAAAPTTPGAVGEVHRTPEGPSAVEAERERLAREVRTGGGAGGTTTEEGTEGEGFIEKIKRVMPGGGGSAAREPSPERRAPLAPAAPISTSTKRTTTTHARAVPAPRPREREEEVRERERERERESFEE